MEGEYEARSTSISPPASYVLRRRSAFKLALIMWLRRWMSDWYRAGYWCMETLVLTSLHMTAEIQAFFRASHAFGFVIALRRAAKIPSSLVGVFRGRRGSRVHHPRYLVCSLRLALWSQTKIM